jgi:hypothetical protein
MESTQTVEVPFDPRPVPKPPRLHWGVVLALQIVTFGTFGAVWLVVQAIWVKRMTGKSGGLVWAVMSLCAFPVAIVLLAVASSVQGGVRILFFVLHVATVFTLRSAMEDFPISISLSGGLTFLLGTIYLQYHLHSYVLPAASDVFGPMPEAPAYVASTSPEPST